jgi:hypothetical protein
VDELGYLAVEGHFMPKTVVGLPRTFYKALGKIVHTFRSDIDEYLNGKPSFTDGFFYGANKIKI